MKERYVDLVDFQFKLKINRRSTRLSETEVFLALKFQGYRFNSKLELSAHLVHEYGSIMVGLSDSMEFLKI